MSKAAPRIQASLPSDAAEPPHDCPLCPRLAAYRDANRQAQPDWWNAPVPSWGDRSAQLLVVGLAPGVRGANRTGRPFTGDFAGVLLYQTLIKFGFATGVYGAEPDDGMVLQDTRIVNAVRCVPPANLPLPIEIRTCNGFLQAELASLPRLRAILALGVVAHNAVLRARGLPPTRQPFKHGQVLTLPDGLLLTDSYHVSRYNTNTGRLTTPMFEAVVQTLRERIGE
ncbi:MAG: uracil-DNA glycosylase [Janthinobacterium lividum]